MILCVENDFEVFMNFNFLGKNKCICSSTISPGIPRALYFSGEIDDLAAKCITSKLSHLLLRWSKSLN